MRLDSGRVLLTSSTIALKISGPARLKDKPATMHRITNHIAISTHDSSLATAFRPQRRVINPEQPRCPHADRHNAPPNHRRLPRHLGEVVKNLPSKPPADQ